MVIVTPCEVQQVLGRTQSEFHECSWWVHGVSHLPFKNEFVVGWDFDMPTCYTIMDPSCGLDGAILVHKLFRIVNSLIPHIATCSPQHQNFFANKFCYIATKIWKNYAFLVQIVQTLKILITMKWILEINPKHLPTPPFGTLSPKN